MSLKFREDIKEDNIVRMSYTKDESVYMRSIVMKCQPRIYDKYKCIKIRGGMNIIGEAKRLCTLFSNLGLKEIETIPKKIEVSTGYIDGFEITLKKDF